jgi:hypothetical protein
VSIISLIITVVVVGIAMWLVNAYVPMEPRLKNLLNIAVVVLVALWLVGVVLGVGGLDTVRVGN